MQEYNRSDRTEFVKHKIRAIAFDKTNRVDGDRIQNRAWIVWAIALTFPYF